MKRARPAARTLALVLALSCGSIACALVAGLEDKQPYDTTNGTGPDGTAPSGDAAGSEGSVVGDAAKAYGGDVVATMQAKPWGVAVDDAFVYWTNEGDGTVMRMAKAGGAPVAIARNQLEPRQIVVDPSNVIWSNSNASNRPGDLDSGGYNNIAHLAKTDIGSAVLPNRIETTKGTSKLRDLTLSADPADNALWTSWLDRVTRYRRTDNGGQADVAKQLTAKDPTAIAVDSVNVYWFLQQPLEIWSAPKDFADAGDASVGKIATLPGASEVAHMVADGTALFMVTTGGAVLKVATPAGGTPQQLGTGQTFPAGITLDDKDVYFTRTGTNDAAGEGLVVMMSKTGTETKVVAAGLDKPRAIVVDVGADGSHTLYWTGYGDGTIRRAKVR